MNTPLAQSQVHSRLYPLTYFSRYGAATVLVAAAGAAGGELRDVNFSKDSVVFFMGCGLKVLENLKGASCGRHN